MTRLLRKCYLSTSSQHVPLSVVGTFKARWFDHSIRCVEASVCVAFSQSSWHHAFGLRWNYLETVFIPFFLRDTDIYGRQLPQEQ